MDTTRVNHSILHSELKKSDGTMISTMNPHTNKQTTGHHFYLANDLPDLQAKAAAWDAARKAAAAKK